MFLRRLTYKWAFGAYWFLFAVLSVFAANSPGYVRHPELAPYPWRALFAMVASLALLVAAFYAVLLPPRFRTSYWRLPLALVLGVTMVTLGELTFATDMPGLNYIPFLFSLLTMLFLLVISIGTVLGALWRRLRATR
jgi:hypothetical protein